MPDRYHLVRRGAESRHPAADLRPGALAATLRTLRYLRLEQVVARAGFVAERRVAVARPRLLPRLFARRLARILPTTRDAPPLWRWPPAPLDPAARAHPELCEHLRQRRVTLLNETRQVVPDWSVPGASRLWRFQLHGFRFAVDLAVAARRGQPEAITMLQELIADWLQQHPIDGSDAWHPFVVSERLIAWLIARDLVRFESAFAARLREAILLQALFLDKHLERDVGGNHLLKNAVALLLAGCAFEGPAAEGWRRRASRLLEHELPRQLLPDGGHYERSPMYHLLVLADLLTALSAAGTRELPISVPLADAVRRMQAVARVLVHPDGDIPLFNDGALGEAPRPSQLIGPSTPPGPGCLPCMGYAVLTTTGGVLIADCGPPGPDDLPAHVHADALSFELSVAEQRVFVNAGTFDYTPGALRDQLRGTAAHNTLQVDGADQSEVYGAFRLGRRARVQLERCTLNVLLASHTGYAHLGVRHERRIDTVHDRGWRITDTLFGSGHHRAEARLRLHPSLHWQAAGERFEVRRSDGQVLLCVQPFGGVEVVFEDGVYAERFSQLQPVRVLSMRRQGSLPMLFGCWLLLPGAEPIVI